MIPFDDPSIQPDGSARILPPQSLEAEQAVLGTILLQADALMQVVEIIKAGDFYRDNHRVIFTAMLACLTGASPMI